MAGHIPPPPPPPGPASAALPGSSFLSGDAAAGPNPPASPPPGWVVQFGAGQPGEMSPPPGPRDHAVVPPPPPPGPREHAVAPPPPPGGNREHTVVPPPPPSGVEQQAFLRPMADDQRLIGVQRPEDLGDDLDLKLQLEVLRRRVHARRRRSFILTNGVLLTIFLGIACWAAYHFTSVYRYAALDPRETHVSRDPMDPDLLTIDYRPESMGWVGFGRTDAERQTELLDRVISDHVGQLQEFQWRMGGLRTGDLVRVVYRRGWSLDCLELPVPDPPAAPVLGDGVLVGRVLSAVGNRPVLGAEVRVVGTRLATTTDRDGRFRLEKAPTGPVPIEVSAEGYSTGQFERKLSPGSECSARVVLNPGMEAGRIRIDLVWEDTALDLDAHLKGPLPGGEQFHVYYHQMGDLRSREFVRLDADEEQSGGPETISVLGVLPGKYQYFVHNYTDRETPQSNRLARSGAEVTLHQGGQTHRFRVGHETPGNVWNVCTIEVTASGAAVRRVDRYEGAKVEALGLYAKRTREDRGEWIGRCGGSRRSEEAVAAGLAWLARHQAEDGSWANYCLGGEDPRSRCEKDGLPCTLPGDKYEMAGTGLTILAFQAGGHYDWNGRKYSGAVRRGLDWMVAHQRPDGALVSVRPAEGRPYYTNYMYDHGIAAFALAEACALAADARAKPNAKYVEATRRAVRYIESQQHHDGSWKYTDELRSPGDASISGWQVLALKSAKEAGIPPSRDCVEKIRGFFRRLEMGENGRTWYEQRPAPVPPLFQTEATTGIGMLVRQFLLDDPDAPLVREAAGYLARYAEETWKDKTLKDEDSKDFYLWYNCTLAMYQAGGEDWTRWNAVVRDAILRFQRIDGCARGSWDATCRWGGSSGRICTTALAVLTLEVYYRYAGRGETDEWFEVDATRSRDR
jgi:hypothetical protein